MRRSLGCETQKIVSSKNDVPAQATGATTNWHSSFLLRDEPNRARSERHGSPGIWDLPKELERIFAVPRHVQPGTRCAYRAGTPTQEHLPPAEGLLHFCSGTTTLLLC